MNNNNIGMIVKQNQMIHGWTWGEIKIEENQIKFDSNRQDWFKIDTNSLSNVIVPNKNEIGIEFNVDDEIGNK